MKTITKVLLCKPLHFAVTYSINPWMVPGPVDATKAMKQWESLVEAYTALGIQIEIIDQEAGFPDMVFATDQGIIQGNKIIVSNFRHKERQGERDPYLTWFKAHHFEPIFLSEGDYIEGNGESLFMGDRLFVGTGFRSSKRVVAQLGRLLQLEAIPLELIDPYFYHLDTAFFPLSDTIAFYYPSAFSVQSAELLTSLIPTLIPFTKQEAQGFAANSIVSGNTVLCQKGNPTFVALLAELGYNAIELDMSEFIKSGGGIHCLTNVLEERSLPIQEQKLPVLVRSYHEIHSNFSREYVPRVCENGLYATKGEH